MADEKVRDETFAEQDAGLARLVILGLLVLAFCLLLLARWLRR